MKNKIFKRVSIAAAITFLVALVVGSFIFLTIIKSTPKLTKDDLMSTSTTKIYDIRGKMIYDVGSQERDYVKYKDIPENYKNALISTEDKTFWTNSGVNFKSTIYAFLGKISGGLLTERGGSTITQQLVKLSVFSTRAQDRTIQRKVREIWLSLQVSKLFTKEQILEYYVNKIYEGQNVYGAETISKLYYGKRLKDLDLVQAATIAGLGQSPSQYNLYTNPKLVELRKNNVLLAMYNNGKIDKATYKKAKNTPATNGLVPIEKQKKTKDDQLLKVQYYISSTIKEAKKLGYDVNKNSYKIYTNYDSEVQDKLIDTLNNSTSLTTLSNPNIQAAGTIVNPNNGKVVAQVGARNDKTLFGLNRATQNTRSSGSVIKPLIDYGPAIEYLNWGSNHIVQDTPYKYAGTNIYLHNYDLAYYGNITMRTALEQSRNIPAVRTLDAVGSDNAKKFLSKIGMDVKKQYGGSDGIGLDVSTEQLARAYSAISNGGMYYKTAYINSIVDANNDKTDYEHQNSRAMKQSTAFILTAILQGVFKPNATGGVAAIPGLVQAGKTGTVGYDAAVNVPAGSASDVSMVGYTKPDAATNSGYVVSVWAGYDNPNAPNSYISADAQNREIQALLYKDVMSKLYKGQKNGQWAVPKTVKLVSGSLANIAYAEFIPSGNQSAQKPLEQPTIKNYTELDDYWYSLNENKEAVINVK